VIVASVTPGKPADKAGIKPQDVIVSIDGKPVKDGDELVAIISAKHPGQTVELGILRNGKKMTLQVGIADRASLMADTTGGDDNSTPDDSDAGQSKLGITVQAIRPADATKMHIAGGVAISTVKPGSFADEINLPAGFVITEINRKPVPDLASYRNIVSGLKSGDDVVFVLRDPRNLSGGDTLVGGTLP
jgi:serine protease Do